MRPTKLTISAFGPYAGEVTIDFDRLGAHGLYPVSYTHLTLPTKRIV